MTRCASALDVVRASRCGRTAPRGRRQAGAITGDVRLVRHLDSAGPWPRRGIPSRALSNLRRAPPLTTVRISSSALANREPLGFRNNTCSSDMTASFISDGWTERQSTSQDVEKVALLLL
jgi:hypothetical protein